MILSACLYCPKTTDQRDAREEETDNYSIEMKDDSIWVREMIVKIKGNGQIMLYFGGRAGLINWIDVLEEFVVVCLFVLACKLRI